MQLLRNRCGRLQECSPGACDHLAHARAVWVLGTPVQTAAVAGAVNQGAIQNINCLSGNPSRKVGGAAPVTLHLVDNQKK